ncbi:MAG: hypothetical protein QM731_14750 [Chitinophagaceae bacterium]
MKLLPVMTVCIIFAGCMTNYPLTTFYVKNNTGKTVNFKASVDKASTMGTFNMTLPFTVLPGDSVIARRVNFKKDAAPTAWFTQFILFPVDSVKLNDPNLADNWVRSADEKGKPVYTFNVTK